MISSLFSKLLPKNALTRGFRLKKGTKKVKEKRMKNATSDDKMIKLTKKEDIEAKEKLEASTTFGSVSDLEG